MLETLQETSTDHFSPADWVDFTRGLLRLEKQTDIQRHLDTGCEECRKSSQFWGLVAETAARESGFEPSPESLSVIRNAFRSTKPVSRLLELATWARLVFDSFVQPSLVAVRGIAQTSRQLLHESEPFTIDLRLEADPGRKRVYLTGQIINSSNPNEVAEGIDVVLLKAADQLTKTEASASGEFCLDFNASDHLQLFLNIRGQRGIAIALPDFES
jgi:hypothetical protein